MWELVMLADSIGHLARSWFALPLIVVVSLVYSASRYEAPTIILRRAGRLSLTITAFMLAVLVLLIVLSYGL